MVLGSYRSPDRANQVARHRHKDGGDEHLPPGADCPMADDPPSEPEPEPTIDPETQRQIVDGTVKAGVGVMILRLLLPILFAL